MFSSALQKGMFVGGGLTIPRDIKSLISATNGRLRTLAGPEAQYSAAAGQVPDGLGGVWDSQDPNHSVDEHGYRGCPAYSNVLSVALGDLRNWEGPKDVIVGSNRITSTTSAGSARVRHFAALGSAGDIFRLRIVDFLASGQFSIDCGGTVKNFTPVVGDIITVTSPGGASNLYIFLNTGGDGGVSTTGDYLEVDQIGILTGPYLHEYIPPGQSVVSTVGTTGGNGVSIPLTGSAKADRLIECYRGVPDGTEVWSDATASGTNWAKVGSTWTHTAGSTVALTDAGKVVIGQRYKGMYVITRTAGSVVAKAGSTGTGGATISAAGTYTEELTCAGSTDMTFVPSSDFAGSVTVTSIQKLLPATGTVACLMRTGVDASGVFGVSSIVAVANNDGVLFRYNPTNIAHYVASFDGSNNLFNTSSDIDIGIYLLCVVEFDGTAGKFRVGNQRFNEDGTAIDADPVWSHATLAGGAPFDGSFNPTPFERLFLDSTVPNHMRCKWTSNQVGLGDAEILRRTRKYGKF